jgi:PAS domain S-box-containing protein
MLSPQDALTQLARLRDWLKRLQDGSGSATGELTLAKAAASLTQVEAVLQANHQLGEALHRALAHYLTETPPQEFLGELLQDLLRLTQSEYGFLGEVLYGPEGAPYLKTHAVTNIAWDAASRALYEEGQAGGMEFRNLQTLFGTVLTTGQPVIANDPPTDPRRGGLPPGHPPLRSFLGLPCCLGGQMMGIVGLANRPGGYEAGLVQFLQPVLDTCGVLIGSFRQHQKRQQAEQALRRNEERFRALVENAFEAVLLLNAKGEVLYGSPRNAWVLGRRGQDVLGRSVFDFVHPEDFPAAKAAFAATLRQPGEPISVALRAQHVDGTWRHIEGIISNWLHAPDIQAIAANFRDVTSRVVAEERQKQSEAERATVLQQLRLILDHMPMACIQNDPQGRFTYWNPAAEKLFGYRCVEVLGRHPFDCITPPESQPYVTDIFRRLQAGEDLIEAEGTNCTRDGSRILCEWSNSPLRSPEGEFLGIVSMCRDITRQRRTEEAQRRSEQLMRAVSEQIPDALFLLDPDDAVCPGRIVEVNEAACRMHRCTREDLIGRSITELDDQATAVQVPERLQRLRQGETLRFEGLHFRKDGTPLPLEIVARLINYGDRRLVLALDRDLSERRKAEDTRRKLEAQIQHTQKLESLGVLAGGIAHDFNNLLTSILGNVSLATMELPPGSPAAYSLQQIETAACRAADLTRQMLAYSGKGRFLIQPLNLSRVVEEMANLLQTVISKKAVLRFDFTPNLPAIKADATQIRQVVMNLITNASDAIADKSGFITLRTGVMFANRDYLATTYVQDELPEGYYAYVDVADTGCGMDGETLSKIFDPFFTTKHTGRGLGLAAVLGIMRGHKGAIKVYSELGRGTSFRLLFPCVEQSPHDSHHDFIMADLPRGSGFVLVADDEETVRALAARLLEKAGFHVLQAADGREAVQLYRQHVDQIRLVLLDWTMPHMGGDEVYRELRLTNPDARVVLMSGYNQQDVMNQLAGKPLAGFVQKPFRASDFLVTVQHALETEKLTHT